MPHRAGSRAENRRLRRATLSSRDIGWFTSQLTGRSMTFQSRWRNRAFTFLAAVVLCVSHAGLASSQEALGSNVNVLVAWDASDHYITPRGLNVEDEGPHRPAADTDAVEAVRVQSGCRVRRHPHDRHLEQLPLASLRGRRRRDGMRSTRSSVSPSSFARGSPLMCRQRRSTRRPIRMRRPRTPLSSSPTTTRS